MKLLFCKGSGDRVADKALVLVIVEPSFVSSFYGWFLNIFETLNLKITIIFLAHCNPGKGFNQKTFLLLVW